MLSCDEATKLIALKKYRKIRLIDRIRLSMHLIACKYCKSFEVFNNKLEDSIEHTCSNISTSNSEITSEKKTDLKNLINKNIQK